MPRDSAESREQDRRRKLPDKARAEEDSVTPLFDHSADHAMKSGHSTAESPAALGTGVTGPSYTLVLPMTRRQKNSFFAAVAALRRSDDSVDRRVAQSQAVECMCLDYLAGVAGSREPVVAAEGEKASNVTIRIFEDQRDVVNAALAAAALRISKTDTTACFVEIARQYLDANPVTTEKKATP